MEAVFAGTNNAPPQLTVPYVGISISYVMSGMGVVSHFFANSLQVEGKKEETKAEEPKVVELPKEVTQEETIGDGKSSELLRIPSRKAVKKRSKVAVSTLET
jgi:hypothetical protein